MKSMSSSVKESNTLNPKATLKCVVRGPVPRFNRKLDYDMIPENLRFGYKSQQPQVLPPSGSCQTYISKYKPISGSLFDKVALYHYINGLYVSPHLSHEGNESMTHQTKESRATSLIRESRGDINILRGAGKEISQDPMKNLMARGVITHKIAEWKKNGNISSGSTPGNVSMFKEGPGLEDVDQESTSFTRGFPLKKVAIILVCLCGVYFITKKYLIK